MGTLDGDPAAAVHYLLMSDRADSGGQRFGDYELLRRLGTGGMGTVYLARLRRAAGFTKQLAVKCIHPRLAAQARFREQFAAEARLSASLAHPHIVQVTDFGLVDGAPYLVMEYVAGLDLEQLLRAATQARQPVPADFGLAVGLACVRALAAAHARRPAVIHGDVCPANILIGRGGEVKLTDFGLARLADRSAGPAGGHPDAMAPEVALGRVPEAAADQFGAAAVLCRLAGGRGPYPPRDTPAAALELARRGAIEPPAIPQPPGLQTVLGRALAADPGQRFSDTDALEQALERVRAAAGLSTDAGAVARFAAGLIDATGAGPPAAGGTLVAGAGSGPARPRRRRWPLAAAALAALLVAAVAVGLAWPPVPQRLPPPAPATVAAGEPEAGPPAAAGHRPRRAPDETSGGGRPAAGAPGRAEPAAPAPAAALSDQPGRSDGADRSARPGRIARSRPPADPPAAGAAARPGEPEPNVAAAEPAAAKPTVPVAPRRLRLWAGTAAHWQLDGGARQSGPLRDALLEPGEHVVRLGHASGLRVALRLSWPAAADTLGLAVHSRPFAVLQLDGRPRGTTPLAGLALEPGDHRLVLSPPGQDSSLELRLVVP